MSPRLAAHLARHLGVVTRQELLGLGHTQRQIEWMVRSGELVRVHLGVYRHAATAVTLEQRVYAGVRAVPTSLASHRCAIALTGARGFASDLVELTSRTTARSRRDGMIVHRSTTIVATDVRRHDLIPATTPARTLIDAATVMSPAVVAKIAQDWLVNRKLRLEDLHACIVRVGTTAAFRRALDEVDLGGADSVPEALLGAILTRAGIPPVLHHVVTTEVGDFELDWAYPAERVGLELDGYGIHARSFDVFEHDRFRRNEIELIGWRVLNFTRRMVRNRPATVVDQVRRALALSRGPQ